MADPELTPEEIRLQKNALQMRLWRKENPDKANAIKSRWRKNNPEMVSAAWQRKSARIKNDPVRLEADRRSRRRKEKRFSEQPAGRISVMVTDAKMRANQRGLEFDEAIRAKFIAAPPDKCPCCGIAFNFVLASENLDRRRSPSLDRFDNLKGYTLENSVVICYRCNSLKSDATLQELEKVVAWMRSRVS